MTPNRMRTLPILAIFLVAYLTAGIFTELEFIEKKPLPERLVSDFRLYKAAYKQALSGDSPYNDVFLYPPPALLVIDLFSHVPNALLQYAFYLTINIVLLCLIVYGIARLYGLKIEQMWFWFPLALGFAPVLGLLHYGQINIITSFGIFLLFYAQQSLPAVSGLGLSLAIVTKFSPLVLLGYLGATRQSKAILWTFVSILILCIIALLRYGPTPFTDYPHALSNLFALNSDDLYAQALVSKLANINRVEAMDWSITQPLKETLKPVQQYAREHPRTFQNLLLAYFGAILLVSGLITLKSREREPLFIVTSLSMLFYPNLIWYHHYVFLILPLMIWMASSNLRPAVVVWCLMGLFVVQADRWHLTYGFLIHLFGHISIWAILIAQVRSYLGRIRKEKQKGAGQASSGA